MCFSASASFGASAVLATIGVITLKKVNTKSQYAFATIPLLFSAQQLTEGFLWLALSNPSFATLENLCTHTFLFFAQVLWPIWVPYAVYQFETEAKRKKTLKPIIYIGALVSAYLAYCLIAFPVKGLIDERHILYKQDYPATISRFGGILYVIATVAPPFFSSMKRMWTLGTAILISYIITTIFYADYLVSVWCFFSSVISIAVYAVIYVSVVTTNNETVAKV